MKYSYLDKWILTNIYDNYIHDLPPNHSLYNELYNEDEYIYIEDPEILRDIYPVNLSKRLLS
jgi:hypothetical protein